MTTTEQLFAEMMSLINLVDNIDRVITKASGAIRDGMHRSKAAASARLEEIHETFKTKDG